MSRRADGAPSVCGSGGEGAYADVDVVGLGEEPAVAAGEGGEVEDEVVGGAPLGRVAGRSV